MPVFSTTLVGMKLCGLARMFQGFLPGFLARDPCTGTGNVWPTWHERVAQVHPPPPWTSPQTQHTPAWGVGVPRSPVGAGQRLWDPQPVQPCGMQGYSSPLSITFCFLQRCPSGPKALWAGWSWMLHPRAAWSLRWGQSLSSPVALALTQPAGSRFLVWTWCFPAPGESMGRWEQMWALPPVSCGGHSVLSWALWWK